MAFTINTWACLSPKLFWYVRHKNYLSISSSIITWPCLPPYLSEHFFNTSVFSTKITHILNKFLSMYSTMTQACLLSPELLEHVFYPNYPTIFSVKNTCECHLQKLPEYVLHQNCVSISFIRIACVGLPPKWPMYIIHPNNQRCTVHQSCRQIEISPEFGSFSGAFLGTFDKNGKVL